MSGPSVGKWLAATCALAACGSTSPYTGTTGSLEHGTAVGATGGGASTSGIASGTTGGATSSGGGSTTGSPAGGLNISGNFTDAVSGNPLESVAVCLISSPSTCTTTDGGGNFLIAGLQASQDGITSSLSGYVTGVWPFTPLDDLAGWDLVLRSDMRISTLAGEAGATLGSNAGAIVFQVYDVNGNDLAGASVALSTGAVGYFDDNGDLSTSLGATTDNGGGFIFGVSPGTASLTFTATGLTCTRASAEGWPATGNATVDVPVVDGELSRAAATCQ